MNRKSIKIFNFIFASHYFFLLMTLLVFTITFLKAYFTPEKAVTIYINTKGESNLELLLLIFLWIVPVYFLYGYFKHRNRPREESF